MASDVLLEQLLAGEPVRFDEKRPRDERLIPAAWLEEGLRAVGRLDVEGAVIADPFALKTMTVGGEVLLKTCVFEAGIEIEYCSFASRFILSESRVYRQLILNATRFASDVGTVGVKLFPEADHHPMLVADCSFEGVFEGAKLRAYGGGALYIVRSTFRSSVLLAKALLSGGIVFETSEIGRDLRLSQAFSGADIACPADRISGTLALDGARLRGGVAGYAASVGRVFAGRINCGGRFDFRFSSIAGTVNMPGARFRSAVDFESARIVGGLFMSGAHIDGTLDLRDAVIDGGVMLPDIVIACRGIAIAATRLSLRGELNLYRSTVDGEVVFRNARLAIVTITFARFRNPVSFYAASLQTIDAQHSRFLAKPACFTLSGTTLSGQLYMDGATFRGECDFVGLRVDQQVSATNCMFGGGLNFYEGHVGRGAFFWRSVHCGDSDFSSMTVGGEFYLSGARFYRKFTANFSQFGQCRFGAFSGKVGSTKRRTCFRDDFEVRGSRIQGATSLSKIDFHKSARFDGTVFSGRVENEAGTLSIGSELLFDGCRFHDVVELNIPRAKLSFRDARFSRETKILGVLRELRLDASVSEGILRIGGEVAGPVDLSNVRSTDLDLRYLNVNGRLDLSGAALKLVLLPQEDTTLATQADTRGCTYERLIGDWRALVKPIDTHAPFDRQPFAQVEQVLRRQGEDIAADRAYLAGRRHERATLWTKGAYVRWMADLLWGKVMTNYGIGKWRPIVFSIVCIAAGTWLFSLPDAVRLKPGSNGPSPPRTLEFTDAMGISANQFLPIPTVIAPDWVPNSRAVAVTSTRGARPDLVAVVLKLLGLCLLPLSIASITGLLKRNPRS